MSATKAALVASETEEADRPLYPLGVSTDAEFDVLDPRADDGDPVARAILQEERWGW